MSNEFLPSSIQAPPGWSTDNEDLGTDDYWADDGAGQEMAQSYGLPKAIPRMCRTGGNVLFLIEGGSSFYFWNPIDGCLWKITKPDNLAEIVEKLGKPGGAAAIKKEEVGPVR